MVGMVDRAGPLLDPLGDPILARRSGGAGLALLELDVGLSWSCYDPQADGPIVMTACGRCDSCRLRRKGFADAGLIESVMLPPRLISGQPDPDHPGPTLSAPQEDAARALVAGLRHGRVHDPTPTPDTVGSSGRVACPAGRDDRFPPGPAFSSPIVLVGHSI